MSDKPPDNKDGLLELLKKLWLPVAGFIGAVTLAYNFYQLWLGDQTTVTYFLTGIGLVVLIITLIWVGFKKTTVELSTIILSETQTKTTREEKLLTYPSLYKLSRILLGSILVGGVVGAGVLIQHRQTLKEKLVVLIAAFDGPEDQYGLRNELVDELKEATKEDQNIEIAISDTIINSSHGSESARNFGKRERADIVIWAWYRPTENPNITIHIENLSPQDFSLIQESETYRPVASIADLESFEIQKRIGLETANLVNFLAGYLQFENGECKTALQHFEKVLNSGNAIPIINQKSLFLFSGHCHSSLRQFNEAIKDYDQAIQADPSLAEAYSGRGSSYGDLGQFDRAVQDLDQAIQIASNSAAAYNSRGYTYNLFEQYDRAIQDLNQAIRINPYYVIAYINLGFAYNGLGQFQLAIQYFDRAIKMDPNFAAAYTNRGHTYNQLGQYEHAIRDFSQAIRSAPNSSEAYNLRAYAYNELGQYKSAIPDLYQAIRIDPNYPISYSNLGYAYNGLRQYEAAIQNFDQAIQMDPNIAASYNGRGYAYNQLGQYEKAIQDFNRVVELDSGYTEAYENRGAAYQALGKTAEAEADFKKYEELTDQKP